MLTWIILEHNNWKVIIIFYFRFFNYLVVYGVQLAALYVLMIPTALNANLDISWIITHVIVFAWVVKNSKLIN